MPLVGRIKRSTQQSHHLSGAGIWHPIPLHGVSIRSRPAKGNSLASTCNTIKKPDGH
jgi:hypothetical protein